MRGSELLASVNAAVLAAQPFAVERVSAAGVGTQPRPTQPLDRLPMKAFGHVPLR